MYLFHFYGVGMKKPSRQRKIPILPILHFISKLELILDKNGMPPMRAVSPISKRAVRKGCYIKAVIVI